MRIVVAGGSGFIGAALVNALRRDGHHVPVLTRRPRRPDDVHWWPGDSVASGLRGKPHIDEIRTGSGASPWQRAVEDADAVINLAGESIADRRWTEARKRAILESRVKATRALVSAIRGARRPPGVLMNASGINVYAAHGDEPLTEESAAGSDFLASVCKAWEAAALEAAPVSRVVLLRSGLVAAKDGGALPKIALPFHFFAGGPIGSGRQYMSWIHRDDWVSMVCWALSERNVSGPLNVTAPTPVRNADFAHTLGRVLHRPAILPVPGFALRLALGQMADEMLLSGAPVIPQKAQAGGFSFRYRELEPALRAIYL
ncbi:MAG: TIGR01777 family oxidoreductase [Vicinamibacterales bacterium]